MATYILNDEKMFSDIADGVAIVINSETGIYYGMNGFGTNVFENILNGADTDAILKALKEIPGVPESMGNHLDSFVEILLTQGLVVPGEASGEVSIDPEIAKNDSFALVVKEYNDAQELLLADPIHEIKQDSGWTPEKDSVETDEEEIEARKSAWKEGL